MHTSKTRDKWQTGKKNTERELKKIPVDSVSLGKITKKYHHAAALEM